VLCCGQIIAGIVARDRTAARKAAKLVKIDYEELTPVILSNEVFFCGLGIVISVYFYNEKLIFKTEPPLGCDR
jgi:xanthine dehydrogenase molybdopterin-binding subunit B